MPNDRLKALVFLDGLLPTPGHSVFDGLAPDVVADRVRAAERFSGGLALPPVPATTFGVIDPDDVAWMERRLTPHPMRTYRDPVHLANPLGNGLACTYLACIDPLYPVVRNSHEQARSREDWTYRELRTCHDAMITAPSLVVEALLDAAAEG